jgi:uncharacterized SAM-binding protein YcdF (DUF218 family)
MAPYQYGFLTSYTADHLLAAIRQWLAQLEAMDQLSSDEVRRTEALIDARRQNKLLPPTSHHRSFAGVLRGSRRTDLGLVRSARTEGAERVASMTTGSVGAVLWAVAGAVLILDALVVLFVSSMHTGIVATFVIGALYVFYGLSRHRARPGARQGPPRWLRIFVPSLTALMLLFFAWLAVLGRMDTATQEEDAVVVLGTAVQDGDVTPALRSRLDVTVDYSIANPDAVIVVAGGLPPGETVSEALAMERYLVTRGVAEHRIVQEMRSTSTSENFVYAKALLDARLGTEYTTAFVTSDYHVLRAAGIAEAAGVRATHVHADTPWYEVPVDYVRESLAIAKFVVTGR